MTAAPTTAIPSSTPRATGSGHGVAVFVWSVWALLLFAGLGYIAYFGVDVPDMDDWEIVPVLAGAPPVNLHWLWAQHNEHRIPLARLVLLALYHGVGPDFRAGMYFNCIALALLSAAMVRTAGWVRGRLEYPDVFFPLALQHPGHCGNILWSWQVGFILSTCLEGALLLSVVRAGPRVRMRGALGAGMCLLVLPLCGATGLAFVPAGAIWLACCGLVSVRAGRGLPGMVMVLLAAAALALTGFYFVGFEQPAHHPFSDPVRAVLAGAQFMSTAFGRLFGPWTAACWPAAAALVIALLGLACWTLFVAWFHVNNDRLRILGLAAFLAGVGGLAAGVGLGRAALIPEIGLSLRYISLTAPLACAFYFIFLLYGRGRIGQALPGFLALVGALALLPNANAARDYGKYTSDYRRRFRQRVEAGVPPFVLANQYCRGPGAIYHDEQRFPLYLHLARRAGIGPFRALRDDPAYTSIPVTPDIATHPDPSRFVLKEPRFVYAVSMNLLYDPGATEYPIFRLSWKRSAGPASTHPDQVFETTLRRDAEERTLVVWVNDTINFFSIQPDDEPGVCKVWDVKLLVPPEAASPAPASVNGCHASDGKPGASG
jgi:hypothetical protein